jgi:tetratricopeptide (TPR) repeat protein
MNKQSYLYGIIGLLAGLIIGYIGTNYINQTYGPPPTADAPTRASNTLPPDHPPTGNAQSNASGGPQTDVLAVIEQARNEPSNFAAQMQAADLFKQINRHEGALEFYQRAYKIKPNDFNLLVALGDTNFELSRNDQAVRWYREALKIKPRHEKTLQNLTQALIAKGDKPAARESLKQLEQVNPGNPAIAQFRSQLQP